MRTFFGLKVLTITINSADRLHTSSRNNYIIKFTWNEVTHKLEEAIEGIRL